MTKERIEIVRKALIPFVKKELIKIDYEGLGKFDAEEFEKDLNEILNLSVKAIEQNTESEETYMQEHFARKEAEQKLWELQQNVSEDCVSRTEAIEWIENLRQMDKCFGNYEDDYFPLSEVIDRLKNVPPVTPTFPKGATNGDMIKAMFPKCCSNMGNFDNGIVVDFMGDLHSFDMEWWNAPYKRGNENEVD